MILNKCNGWQLKILLVTSRKFPKYFGGEQFGENRRWLDASLILTNKLNISLFFSLNGLSASNSSSAKY
jgi:hypothetical protein